jgi:hypothetical protein
MFLMGSSTQKEALNGFLHCSFTFMSLKITIKAKGISVQFSLKKGLLI